MNMDMLKKSCFFEFSGMPKSGKTTVIESVRHLYRRYGFSVQHFRGHDRGVPIDKVHSANLNLVLALRAAEYVATHAVSDAVPTIHFLDRGIFDRTIFTKVLYQNNEISLEECSIIEQLLLLKRNVAQIDGLFVFDVPSQLSLQREYAGTLLPLPGRVMNDEYLHRYRNILLDCYEKKGKHFKNSFLISTANSSPRETGVLVARSIWEIIGGNADDFPID